MATYPELRPTQDALAACAPYGGIYPGSDPSTYVEPDPGTPDQMFSWKISCLQINARVQYDCTGGAERNTVCTVRAPSGVTMTCPDRYKNPATGQCDANFKENPLTGQMELIPATKPWHYGYVAPTDLATGGGEGGAVPSGGGGVVPSGGGGGGGGGAVPSGDTETESNLGKYLLAVVALAALRGGVYWWTTKSKKTPKAPKAKGK